VCGFLFHVSYVELTLNADWQFTTNDACIKLKMLNYRKYRRIAGRAGIPPTLLAVNRLPVTVSKEDGVLVYKRSGGGVASMLESSELSGVLCVGWPGIIADDPKEQEEIAERLLNEYRCLPVFLSENEVREYYTLVANGILWPLFHGWKFEGPRDILENLERYWKTYTEVNKKFSEIVLMVSGPDVRVWVHDYHLLVVGRMLREQQPSRAVSFFLHIPLPDPMTLTTFPKYREILEDLLWYNFIGLQTFGRDVKNAISCFENILHMTNESSRQDGVVAAKFVSENGNATFVDSVGIGIDTEKFEAMMSGEVFQEKVKKLRQTYQGKKLCLSYGRLDHTKGYVETLLAVRRALEKYPVLVEQQATFIFVVSPSREDAEKYTTLKDEIDRMISSINSRFCTDTWTPLVYFYRNLTQEKLFVYARVSEVLLFVPVADGMNMAVLEACFASEGAMVVASDRMGALERLGGGIIVNPRDIEAIADAIYQACTMEGRQRYARMKAIRKRIAETNLRGWITKFFGLWQFATDRSRNPSRHLAGVWKRNLFQACTEAGQVVLIADSDGTQLDICSNPDDVIVPTEHMTTLQILACFLTLVLPSGRKKEVMDRWYGELHDAHFTAEHGGFVRYAGEEWVEREIPREWVRDTAKFFEEKGVNIPGLRVEEKDTAIACHYRHVKEGYTERIRDMISELRDRLEGSGLVIREDNCVVEVIHSRGTKAAGVLSLLSHLGINPEEAVLLVLGDGESDEEVMRALPANAYKISVGKQLFEADYVIKDPQECRAFLSELAEALCRTKAA
jgi:trehalose 6-phosphate synthase/phosphatase